MWPSHSWLQVCGLASCCKGVSRLRKHANKIQKQFIWGCLYHTALMPFKWGGCAPGISTNGLTNDSISTGVWVSSLCMCMGLRAYARVMSFLCICVCVFHRWSVKAIHSALPLPSSHYSPLSPLNTCIPTTHHQLLDPHTTSVLSGWRKRRPITSIYGTVYIYVQERG